MANPFLVLGGIAVGIITAAFGVLAVPGWVASAQDASTVNDLSSIRIAQSAAASQHGTYFDDIAELTAGGSGVVATLSRGTDLLGLATDGDKAWCAAAQSESGGFFAVSGSGIDTTRHDDAAQAMTAAGCRRASADAILDDTYGTPTEVRRNLAINPRGGVWKSSWDPRFGFTNDRWGDRGTYSMADGWVRFTASSGTNSHGFSLASNPDTPASYPGQTVSVTPGTDYAISLRARMNAGTTTPDGKICWRFADETGTWTTARRCSTD
ncbi:hypothetical protein, partial [Microbacterium sp. 77mftsu3.1]|uniref:hypothetical protein n=1 Tax=Microbacterium sp. 77mftsu3.1 TaxID=1761802 RepID=UPI00088503B7